jgi:hypothetical protein
MAIKEYSKVNDYITILGTGNAHATRCYNTCFTLQSEKEILLLRLRVPIPTFATILK